MHQRIVQHIDAWKATMKVVSCKKIEGSLYELVTESPEHGRVTQTVLIFPEQPMPTDAQKAELKDKVGRLVAERFSGSYPSAFAHYDDNGDGKIGRSELLDFLRDAAVGNLFTRGTWADGIIAELDLDHDGMISAAEFSSVLH